MSAAQGTGIRRILNKERVRLTDSGVMVGCTAAGHRPDPAVTLRKDAASGRITQIEVTCSCGEVIVIDCHYDDAAVA